MFKLANCSHSLDILLIFNLTIIVLYVCVLI